jgi:hypothetical protein
MSDSRLHVDFDEPSHGWIGIKVSAVEQQFAERVSYTPNDFLLELASAVLLALEGQAGTAVAHSEPNNFDFIFTPVEKQGLTHLEIVRYYSMRKRGETVFTFEAQTLQIARPFWKAMRDAETRSTTDEYREAMRRGFPIATVKRLGERIRSMCE